MITTMHDTEPGTPQTEPDTPRTEPGTPQTEPDTPQQSRSTRSQLNKPLLFGVGAIVVLGIGLYLGGLFQGRGQLATQKVQYEQRIKTAQSELQDARKQLNTAQNRSLLMQARAALYRTAVDLDRRNFGTANRHLREAAEVLGKVNDSSGSLDVEQISQLHSSTAEMDINVAADLEEQRTRVLDLAMQLNVLMPELPTGATE